MCTDALLTVVCPSGLANRLRVLLSGLILAEVTGRRFRMIWPLTPACNAAFHQLFCNDWDIVTDAPAGQPRALVFSHLRQSTTPDLLTFASPELVIQHVDWLFAPADHPHHAPLLAWCSQWLDMLTPLPALQTAIDGFAERHFRPTMIGVHLRRGDFVRRRPNVVANTQSTLAAIDRCLERAPAAGILLCTDDGGPDQITGRVHSEGVRAQLVQRYGDRVVWTTPRSLDRRTPLAIQAAVIDLWLLRRTQFFVGTLGSSFSALGAFGREVDAVFCAGATPTHAIFEQCARTAGLDALLRRLPLSRRLGTQPSFQELWEYYTSLPGRARRRLATRVRQLWR